MTPGAREDALPLGELTPRVVGPIPGPASRALSERLRRVESRNVTRMDEHGPVFWVDAAGSNVRDGDGNIYVDLTGGFGVAAAGHGDPAVTEALSAQARRLIHALGDVHPAAVKVELLERLADLTPGDLSVTILSANGSDAVESALKTAALATGRSGVVSFHGAYHGLGYGALSVTSASRFREPFLKQLHGGVAFATYPDAGVGGPESAEAGPSGHPAAVASALEEVRALITAADGTRDAVGAVIVEPIQGRGGIIVPPAGFLPGLRGLCDELGVVLIMDEVYTGFGRTGRWFACEHEGVVPDLLVVGKSLAGGLPLSAVIGSPGVMDAWPLSEGEAIHTSTFLGNPVACAAALAHLREIEAKGLVERSRELGETLNDRLRAMAAAHGGVAGARGRGLMQALVLKGDGAEARAPILSQAALRRGVLVLPEGPALALTPPLVITEQQLDAALEVLEATLAETARS